MTETRAASERLDVRVYGQVQGVGFRPYVHGLAHQLGLSGWVCNDDRGVRIEVQGERTQLNRFVDAVRRGPSTRARVERIEIDATVLHAVQMTGAARFDIIASACSSAPTTELPPDSAVCDACLIELFDPADRRYRYPFINCTACGPRYTITEALPFDRARTTMADFVLCRRCRDEYRDPGARRFHAEATACPACGPRLRYSDAGVAMTDADPVAAALSALRAGAIIAIKGLGGFHLACDARNPAALAALRARKRRAARPFGLMVLNADSLDRNVVMSAAGRSLLESAERPLVLLDKRPGCDETFAGVAPGVGCLGVMLPHAPVHYLLFHEAADRPSGAAWLHDPHPLALVMTSANSSGEPLITDNTQAEDRLRGIADGFLWHNRDIAVRCDDSVVLTSGGQATFVRRARGYVPQAIEMPAAGPPILALGGGLKNTVCVTRGSRAYLSPHVGDLVNLASVAALEQTVERMLEFLGVRPAWIVHDLHPDYPSTQLAARLAQTTSATSFGVQHHHAHVAAVAAEHGLTGEVLGVALDGVGLGSDGSAWGGELLRCGRRFDRLGHLRCLALPGGDRAAREPWRMASSVLYALGEHELIESRYPEENGRVLRQMLDRGINCPLSSSAGRLFDAAAAVLGIRDHNRFEAEAAMNLEALAQAHGEVAPLPGGYRLGDDLQLDLLPLFAALIKMSDRGHGAALFHATFVAALAAWVSRAAATTGLERVVLAGGCFLNRVLTDGLRCRLEARGLRVYQARRAPPNDGGLSLGQAWLTVLHANERNQ